MNCIIETSLLNECQDCKKWRAFIRDYHDKQFKFQQGKYLLDIMNYTGFRY